MTRVTASQPWLVLLITLIGTPLLGLLLIFFVPLLSGAKRLGRWLKNVPPWWFQQGFVALLIGSIVAGVSLWMQIKTEDDRSRQAKEDENKRFNHAELIEGERSHHAEQVENLRFVRDRSSLATPSTPPPERRFAGLDLVDQDLSGLALRGADLSNAKLQQSDMRAIDISVVPATDQLDLPGKITNAHLNNAILYKANLIGVNGYEADLTDADLEYAVLCAANLKGARLHGANLTGANLTASAATVTDDMWVYGWDIPADGYKNRAADLTDADLSGAILTDAKLDGTILTNIFYDGSTIWPQGFNPPPSRPQP